MGTFSIHVLGGCYGMGVREWTSTTLARAQPFRTAALREWANSYGFAEYMIAARANWQGGISWSC